MNGGHVASLLYPPYIYATVEGAPITPNFFPTLAKAAITRYEVTITEEMIDNEITRLSNRYGNMKDQETVNTDENVLNVNAWRVDVIGIDGR